MTDYVKEFIKTITHMDNSRHNYQKFEDFCELAFCAMAKSTADKERADQLEDRYMQIVAKYDNKAHINTYAELLGMMIQSMEELRRQDFLGSVASQLEILNPHTGQFFTPYPVARMSADMILQGIDEVIKRQGYFTIDEPACGAGVMLMCAADTLVEMGYDPMLHMLAQATDVSRLAYHMCYIQLTLKGIPAWVQHGNTLSLEVWEGAWTVGARMFKMWRGHLFDEPNRSEKLEYSEPRPEAETNVQLPPLKEFKPPTKQLKLL